MILFVSKIFDTYVTWTNPSGRSFLLSEDIFYPRIITRPYKLPYLYVHKGDIIHLIISNMGKVELYINLGIDTRMRCEKCAFYDKHIDYCTNRMFTCNGAYTPLDRMLEDL